MTKFLGVDYGKKKIGLAVSEGVIASPLKTIKVDGLNEALVKINQLIKLEGIDQVVIGLPESGEAKKITNDFIKSLGKDFPVIAVDETLSTYQAIRLETKDEDATAAAIILQNYLDDEKP